MDSQNVGMTKVLVTNSMIKAGFCEKYPNEFFPFFLKGKIYGWEKVLPGKLFGNKKPAG